MSRDAGYTGVSSVCFCLVNRQQIVPLPVQQDRDTLVFKQPTMDGFFPLQIENGSVIPMKIFIFGVLLLHRFLTRHKGPNLIEVQRSAQCTKPCSLLVTSLKNPHPSNLMRKSFGALG